MKHTVEDFWRMIWENDVAVVVMLANVIEAGKVTRDLNLNFIFATKNLFWNFNFCLFRRSYFRFWQFGNKNLQNEKWQEKVYHYWPSEKEVPVNLGDFSITLRDVEVKKENTTRRIEVKNNESGNTKVVNQLHYTNWPDHGLRKIKKA